MASGTWERLLNMKAMRFVVLIVVSVSGALALGGG